MKLFDQLAQWLSEGKAIMSLGNVRTPQQRLASTPASARELTLCTGACELNQASAWAGEIEDDEVSSLEICFRPSPWTRVQKAFFVGWLASQQSAG